MFCLSLNALKTMAVHAQHQATAFHCLLDPDQ